jgi:hypothetical protein
MRTPVIRNLIIAGLVIASGDALSRGKKNLAPPRVFDDKEALTFTAEYNFYHIQGAQDGNGSHIADNTLYQNMTLEYRMANGWDFQLESINIPYLGGGAQNHNADSYFNLSKTFRIYGPWKAIIGTQNGTVFASPSEWHNADYGMAIYQPSEKLNLHAGPYFVDKTLAVTTNTIGYTGGFSYHDYGFGIEADYFSGHNNLSGANVNVFYGDYYMGVVVPERASENEFAGVLGMRKNLSSLLKYFK